MPKPIEPVYRQFGAKIEAMRTAIGVSQQDLSKKLRMTRSSLTNIETGRQRVLLNDVVRFAEALGTSPRFLLKGIWL